MMIAPEVVDIVTRNGIELDSIIDARADITYHYMWRSAQRWPYGGTYEADHPHDTHDRMVARRTSANIEIELLGTHPGAEILFTPGDQPRSRITITDDGPWVFLDTPE